MLPFTDQIELECQVQQIAIQLAHIYNALAMQPTPRPTRHVDDRVHIIQAIALTRIHSRL